MLLHAGHPVLLPPQPCIDDKVLVDSPGIIHIARVVKPFRLGQRRTEFTATHGHKDPRRRRCSRWRIEWASGATRLQGKRGIGHKTDGTAKLPGSGRAAIDSVIERGATQVWNGKPAARAALEIIIIQEFI